MEWGRYKGERLSDIDLNYLVWVLTKAERTSGGLARRIRTEFQRRDVRMPLTTEHRVHLGDVVNDDSAWEAFCNEKGWW